MRVLPVQVGDPPLGEMLERLVLRQGLLAGIDKVCQQTERDVVVPIAEEPHLQRFDQALDVLRARDQGRNDDQRPGGRRDSPRQVHLRQGLGPRQPRHDDVHERDRHLARAEQQQDPDEAEEPARRAFRSDLQCSAAAGSSVRAAMLPR